MATDTQRALEACEAGIALAEATFKTNKELSDYYNNTLIPEYNAKYKTWEDNKNAATTKLSNWTNQTGEYAYLNDDYNKLKDEIKLGICGYFAENTGEGNEFCNRAHGSDWTRAGGIEASDCFWAGLNRPRCKRTDSKLNNEFQTLKNSKKPADFTEVKPEVPIEPAQNTTPISIACCANSLNIVGSEIDETQINQQNDCLGNLKAQQKIELQQALQVQLQQTSQPSQPSQNIISSQTQPPLNIISSQTQPPLNIISSQQQQQQPNTIQKTEQVQMSQLEELINKIKTDNQTQMLIIFAIIIIIIILLSSSSISVAL